MGMSVQRHAPAFLPPEKRPSTNCVGSWEDPRAGLHGCPPPGFNPRSVQPAASRYANYTIPAHRSSCQHFYISFLHFQRLSFLLRVCEILTPIGPRLVVKPQDTDCFNYVTRSPVYFYIHSSSLLNDHYSLFILLFQATRSELPN